MTILEILEAHTYHTHTTPHSIGYWARCTCGWTSEGQQSHDYDFTPEHRAHQAQVLEQHEREAKAAVLTDAAANLARESDQFATTAERLTGHDNTRYHAYSAARQSIAHQLRDRAAQLKETL